MRNQIKVVFAMFMASVGLAIFPGGLAAATMNVQVREAQVRATASFLGKLVASCAYGDQVTVQESRGDWRKVVLTAGQSGWMHVSALTSRKIVLQTDAPTAQTAASSDELALAGKGFNSDVEAEFKRRNQNIDFTWVDRMEKIRMTPDQIQAFLKAGGVQPAAGGAQ